MPLTNKLNKRQKTNVRHEQTIAAAGGIVTRVDKQTGRIETLLVLSAGKNGYWGFPKGAFPPNEVLVDAARQKVNDQTGLEVCLHELNHTWQTTYQPMPGIQKTVTYFWFYVLSTYATVRINKQTVANYAWVDFTTADLYLTYSEDQKAYRAFLTFMYKDRNKHK